MTFWLSIVWTKEDGKTVVLLTRRNKKKAGTCPEGGLSEVGVPCPLLLLPLPLSPPDPPFLPEPSLHLSPRLTFSFCSAAFLSGAFFFSRSHGVKCPPTPGSVTSRVLSAPWSSRTLIILY